MPTPAQRTFLTHEQVIAPALFNLALNAVTPPLALYALAREEQSPPVQG